MNLSIEEIKNSDDFMRERVVLKASQDCDLGKYLIARSLSVNESEFSAKLKNIFWFPDRSIKQNDLVVVYSKKGENKTHTNEDGTTTHFFYWGLDEKLSDTVGACVVLLNASWQVEYVPSVPSSTETN